MRVRPSLISVLILPLVACSTNSKPQATIYAAGDKATMGTLVYNLTDAETTPQLGDDPANQRTAQNRFYLLKVTVSNSGNEDQPIPGMTLVDDGGKMYNELSDGTGVSNWLGVVRKVSSAQTEQGYVVFDAPLSHYRLRLNDTLDEKEIAIDVPATFVRDRNSIGLPALPSGPTTSEIAIPKKN